MSTNTGLYSGYSILLSSNSRCGPMVGRQNDIRSVQERSILLLHSLSSLNTRPSATLLGKLLWTVLPSNLDHNSLLGSLLSRIHSFSRCWILSGWYCIKSMCMSLSVRIAISQRTPGKKECRCEDSNFNLHHDIKSSREDGP